ncbi:MAG: hypothetical protein PHR77_18620 [Kiritimatiellae bacterium]|nr:hypothetical protein [Kiritimatiellia bacterium]
MKSVIKLSVFVFAGFLLVVSVLFAGILVCRECGYENPEGKEACVHCKAKLPVVKTSKQPAGGQAENNLSSGRVKFIDPTIVENEIQMAQKIFDTGDFETANLFARNAAALEMLTDPAVKGERSERIVELRKKSETGGMTVDRKCPACGGTGRLMIEAQAMDGKTTNIEVAGKSCQKCSGTGKVMRPSTMDERRLKMWRGMSRYTALQQSRKYVQTGAAWIPVDLEGKLSVKNIIQVKKTVAGPCPACMGLGRVDCSKCKGQGELKCTFQGCVRGKVEVTEDGRLVKGKAKRDVKCKNCNGTGFVACVECRGKGSLVCKKCNGNGERSLCVKCGGQGGITCKRCQGSGTSKDTICEECRGEGVLECSSCNGDGRKR